MSHSGFPRCISLLGVSVLTASSLSACYVVPIDPRTGQMYPASSSSGYPGNAGNGPSTAVAFSAPVAAPAPPQPSVLSVRLYPINSQANQGGLLTAVVVDNNTGHGSFTVPYRGDTLQGESNRVDAGYASFGRIHDEVLGHTTRSFGGRRGVANAFGSKGVNAQCEYLLTGPDAGTGACLFSDGAKYQMHFGG